jgi:hypothetical protein
MGSYWLLPVLLLLLLLLQLDTSACCCWLSLEYLSLQKLDKSSERQALQRIEVDTSSVGGRLLYSPTVS